MRLLQHTVRRQAERRPDALALVFNNSSMTYGELEERGNQVAHFLKAVGCVPGDRVGLLLPKSIQAVVGMLGVLKAGCIYVPMDTASPAARLARIVQVCEPKCILSAGNTQLLLHASLPDAAHSDIPIGWLGDNVPVGAGFPIAFTWNQLGLAPCTDAGCYSSPDDAAHILFTSGSTGIPKGVVITHENAMSFLRWAVAYFRTEESDRISGHPPLHFDLSTFDIWGTLMAGAELHLVPPDISLLPHNIADFIRRNELTQWFSVPSVLRYMAQFDVVGFDDFPSLKRLLWCGEAIPTPTLIHWMKRLPKVSFTNLYGPTEATIASSFYTVPCCPEDDKSEVPIGTACDGEQLSVRDEALNPVAPGEIGDLYISGVGLSPGYWRDNEKTDSVFISHPVEGRMYKTGDLARKGEDGLFYILGRADSQIKSRGYRIELGEIETALHALGVLQECAVVGVQTSGFEGTAICCAYVLRPGMEKSPADLRHSLTGVLPSYMMPAQWMAMDSLPLNANGKVDRPRLRERFMDISTAA